MIKKLYVVSPRIGFKAFQALQKKLVQDSGPTPKDLDKTLWQLLREELIYCYFSDEMEGDMGVCIKLPPHAEAEMIINP